MERSIELRCSGYVLLKDWWRLLFVVVGPVRLLNNDSIKGVVGLLSIFFLVKEKRNQDNRMRESRRLVMVVRYAVE